MYRKCLTLDPKDEKVKAELGYIAEHRPKKAADQPFRLRASTS